MSHFGIFKVGADTAEFFRLVFSLDGTERTLRVRDLCAIHFRANELSCSQDVEELESGVIQQNYRHSHSFLTLFRKNGGVVHCQADTGASNHGCSGFQNGVFLQHSLHVVESCMLLNSCSLDKVEKAAHEWICGRNRHPVLQDFQNIRFHVQNFLACVGMVADVAAVSDLGRIDFFVFAGNQEGGDANKLKLGSFYDVSLEVSINDVNTKIQCFWNEAKLHMYLDQPIDKNRSHILVELWLELQVWFRTCYILAVKKSLHHVRNVVWHFLTMTFVAKVCRGNGQGVFGRIEWCISLVPSEKTKVVLFEKIGPPPSLLCDRLETLGTTL